MNIIKPLRTLLVCASAAVLAACATATPYQPASEPGGFDGFSQTMLEADRARITFGGNSLTERDTVENYMLYRAAETALERGYDWFELQEQDTEKNTRVRVDRDPFASRFDPYFGYSFYRPRFGWSDRYAYSRFGGFSPYGTVVRDRFGRPVVVGGRGARLGFGRSGFYSDYRDPFFNDFDVREITKYRASAEVRFGNGPKPAGADRAFDARSVIENLGPTIERPDA